MGTWGGRWLNPCPKARQGMSIPGMALGQGIGVKALRFCPRTHQVIMDRNGTWYQKGRLESGDFECVKELMRYTFRDVPVQCSHRLWMVKTLQKWGGQGKTKKEETCQGSDCIKKIRGSIVVVFPVFEWVLEFEALRNQWVESVDPVGFHGISKFGHCCRVGQAVDEVQHIDGDVVQSFMGWGTEVLPMSVSSSMCVNLEKCSHIPCMGFLSVWPTYSKQHLLHWMQ